MRIVASARAAIQPGLGPRTSKPAVALRLFLTCWLVYVLHFATNIVRETYPALSLGDHLSFDVTEYLGLHPDIFEVPGRGAFINNNPGASLMGAIPYALARPVIALVTARVQQARAASAAPPPEYDTIYAPAREFYRQAYERGLDVKLGLAAAVMQVYLMAPLSAFSAVVMYFLSASRISSRRAALLLALLYAFATPVFYRTAQLNQNLLLGHCALFAFALLWRPWDDPVCPRRPAYLAAGLLTGWTVVLDYSGLAVVPALALYAYRRRSALPPAARQSSDLWLFAGGVLAGLAVLGAYQWLAFGHPLYPAQRYMPPTTYSDLGYHGLSLPQPDLLWLTAFGLRYGLFTTAPLLLLALYVPAWFGGPPSLLGKLEIGCALLLTVLLFGLSSANQYGRLQFNSGLRYMTPAVPFLFLIAAGVLLRLPWRLAALIGGLGIYWSWCLSMYRDVEQGLGIPDALLHVTLEGFRLPWLGTLQRLGYISADATAGPLLLLCAVLLGIVWLPRPIGGIRK